MMQTCDGIRDTQTPEKERGIWERLLLSGLLPAALFVLGLLVGAVAGVSGDGVRSNMKRTYVASWYC
jgi:hypothetical protein